MEARLRVYQYEKHALVQLTDGRIPNARDEHAAGWVLRGDIDASAEGVSEVSAVSPQKVFAEIKRSGWSQLNRFEIQEKWREKWVDAV
jgi:hypothetical protein